MPSCDGFMLHIVYRLVYVANTMFANIDYAMLPAVEHTLIEITLKHQL